VHLIPELKPASQATLFAGKVVEVAALTDVQDKVYEEPTILLANRVSGEEEIPQGVVAVVTPDAPDILSHSSVRARNMKVRPWHEPGLMVQKYWPYAPLQHASVLIPFHQDPCTTFQPANLPMAFQGTCQKDVLD
jgi:hypothetical protein